LENKEKKQKIIDKYESEAKEKNSEEWLSLGGSARVPESKASDYFIDRKVTEALKLLDKNISSSAVVLEIGCSFGHMTSLLAGEFDNITALDISPTSVEIASKRLAKYGVNNVHFVVDDAEKLDNIADNSIDVIFSFSTLRFCPDQEKALRSVHSKLRTGGVAIIDFPNCYSPWHLFVKKVFRIKKHIHDTLYSEKQLVEIFAECDLKIEKKKTYLFTTRRLPSLLLPLFKAIDFTFERIPVMRKLGGIIIVKARKL